MQIWINGGILSKDDLFKIERRVEMLKVPHSIGRLPLKISTGFSGFSADQWRNWTICFFTCCAERNSASKSFKILASVCESLFFVKFSGVKKEQCSFSAPVSDNVL